MEQRIRENFQLMWLAAIVLCGLIAVFALFYGSIAHGDDGWTELSPGETPAGYTAASGEPAAVTFTPQPTDTPEPTFTPEPTPEITPVPEPEG